MTWAIDKESGHSEENYPNIRVFVDILMWSSAMINPIIYCLLNETYRNAYIKLCRDFVGLPDETVIPSNLGSTFGRSIHSFHSSRHNQEQDAQL